MGKKVSGTEPIFSMQSLCLSEEEAMGRVRDGV